MSALPSKSQFLSTRLHSFPWSSATCNICNVPFSNLSSNGNITVTPCGHIFCEPCILGWLQSSNKCYQCERKLFSEIVPTVANTSHRRDRARATQHASNTAGANGTASQGSLNTVFVLGPPASTNGVPFQYSDDDDINRALSEFQATIDMLNAINDSTSSGQSRTLIRRVHRSVVDRCVANQNLATSSTTEGGGNHVYSPDQSSNSEPGLPDGEEDEE